MTDAKKQAQGSASAEGEFEEVRIPRKDKPDVKFRGRLLAQVDSRGEDRRGVKDRWTQLELYELESGKWVAASVGCSNRDGEIDFGEVCVIDERTAQIEITIGEGVSVITRETRVMEFFGYTWLSKLLAEQLGWDVDEVIE